MNHTKIYFPGLNGLRFFAAGLVVIHHLEYFKNLLDINSFIEIDFVAETGGLGVTFFFVLSGFLITYLLMTEKMVTRSVNIRKFYIRRILRIWPLYFFIIILALFLLNKLDFFYLRDWTENVNNNLPEKIVLYFFFLPNIVAVIFYPILFSSQVWSIGVEEQFYLLWPVLIKYFRNTLMLLLSVIIIYISILIMINNLKRVEPDLKILQNLQYMSEFIALTRIDCMAIGGIGAYMIFSGYEVFKRFIFSYTFQVLLYILVAFLLFRGVYFKYFNMELYSLLFCLIILNVSSNSESILKFENRILNYLGRISYGIYMYHPVAILLVLKTLKRSFFETNIIIQNIFIYLMVFIITIGLASISFTFFESKFTDLKVKFSEIITGDNVKAL